MENVQQKVMEVVGTENKEMTYTGIMNNSLPVALTGTKVAQAREFMSEIFGSVRTVTVNGKVWFVGKDIAKCLGYKDTAQAIRNHCKGVVETTTPTAGGVQTVKIINEYDVIRLVVKSRLHKAQEFEAWVFEEVIPQTLKTGGYIPVGEQDTEETIQQRAQEIAEETIKYKYKEIARLKESYGQEHEARLRLIKTYNESKKEIRGLQNELDEAYVKMDLVPLMMEIQNKCEPPRELDLKSIIIKMNDTSKGYQRYKQWVEDNCMTDGAVDKECGHFLKHSKLHCFTKQYIFDLESVDALYYLALMFEEVMLNC